MTVEGQTTRGRRPRRSGFGAHRTKGCVLEDHLSGLLSGDVARIAGVEAAQAAAKRLADMGFVRGAVVEMVRPGKPCLVRIGGTYVGLGLENQNSLRVEPV